MKITRVNIPKYPAVGLLPDLRARRFLCVVTLGILATACAPAGGLVIHNQGGVIMVIGSTIEKDGANTATQDIKPDIKLPVGGLP